MSERLGGEPSDFPRDERFRNPRTPPFCDEQGMYHVFSYADVMRVLMNRDAAFSRDPSPWLPTGFQHMALDFMWAVEPLCVLNIWFAAANRDQEVNGGKEQSDPAVFDPRRSPNWHLGLGWAKHFCLGAGRARLEIRVLLQEGLRRLPWLQMDRSKSLRRYAGIADGVTEAPFTFDQDEADRIMSARRNGGTS